MAKHPTTGKVKTRLAESIGHKEATSLYQCFLEDMIIKIKRLNIPFFIYFTPSNKKKDFKRLFGNNLTYSPQIGEDLGERLYNGFTISIEMGYTSAIALATDIPDLPESILSEAVLKLEEYDSVIGPSIDGGYYLIGLRKSALTKNLFQGITWSTEKVYDETMKKIEEEKITCYSLPHWDDVDTVDDLKRLLSSSDLPFQQSHTGKYLKKYQIN